MKKAFQKFSAIISNATGSPAAFVIAFAVVIIWGVSGDTFNYSDTWQLVINTGTTIVTFLMVFLIQNTQNRDSKAMQLKLDELIRVTTKARDSLVSLENMTDAELAALDQEFNAIRDKHEASEVLHHLHTKIAAEHQRRHILKDILVSTKNAVASRAHLPTNGQKAVDKHKRSVQK